MDDRDQRLSELEQQVSALEAQVAAQPPNGTWPLWRNLLVPLVALAVVAGTGVALVSAHNGDPSLVHSCVNTSTGTIRITNPSTSATGTGPDRACSSGEVAR